MSHGRMPSILATDPAPEGHFTGDSAPCLKGRQAEAEDLATALMAVGASWGHAAGQASASHGRDAVQAMFEALLSRLSGMQPKSDRILDGCGRTDPLDFTALLSILDEVSDADPTTANTWLGEALCVMGGLPSDPAVSRGVYLMNLGWVTGLPDGLVIQGNLSVADCPNLTTLPDCLWVWGYLDAERSGLTTLPTRLHVGTHLSLGGCAQWDGVIPDDALVGDRIYTDRTLQGVTLDEWRRRA